ncbi:hypothetical protein L195_g049113, partial [Trifolium pratense]
TRHWLTCRGGLPLLGCAPNVGQKSDWASFWPSPEQAAPAVVEEKPGKKKGKKGNAKSSQVKDNGDDFDVDDDVPEIVFARKKKGKSKKSGGNFFKVQRFSQMERRFDQKINIPKKSQKIIQFINCSGWDTN